MSQLSSVFGATGSLRRGLVCNIIAALSLCILLAGTVMVFEFYEHLEENLEDALTEEAKEIIGQIDPNAAKFGVNGDAGRFPVGLKGLTVTQFSTAKAR